MTAATATGTAFGSLLRDWRQRRRLTQLELGLAADVSARHLSFLETGRSRPSREMVLLLADELDVPLRGRNELMIAAGFAPAYSQHGLDDAELGEVQRSLRRVLDGHEPYPAVLVDGMWNLVAGNRAVQLLTELVDPALLTPPVNVRRVSLHPRGLAPHVIDLQEYAAHVVSRLRGRPSGRHTGLRALLGELVGYCRDAGDPDRAATGPDRAAAAVAPPGQSWPVSTVAVLAPRWRDPGRDRRGELLPGGRRDGALPARAIRIVARAAAPVGDHWGVAGGGGTGGGTGASSQEGPDGGAAADRVDDVVPPAGRGRRGFESVAKAARWRWPGRASTGPCRPWSWATSPRLTLLSGVMQLTAGVVTAFGLLPRPHVFTRRVRTDRPRAVVAALPAIALGRPPRPHPRPSRRGPSRPPRGADPRWCSARQDMLHAP